MWGRDKSFERGETHDAQCPCRPLAGPGQLPVQKALGVYLTGVLGWPSLAASRRRCWVEEEFRPGIRVTVTGG